jgi:uncharacterized protein (DUF2267 family)
MSRRTLLPSSHRRSLGLWKGRGGGEPFAVDEFYERVAQREGVGTDEAIRHARAVATVLQTAVTGGELEDVRSQLSNDYEELFGQPGSSV